MRETGRWESMAGKRLTPDSEGTANCIELDYVLHSLPTLSPSFLGISEVPRGDQSLLRMKKGLYT